MGKIRVNTDTGYDTPILCFFVILAAIWFSDGLHESIYLLLEKSGVFTDAAADYVIGAIVAVVFALPLAVVLLRWAPSRVRDLYGCQLFVATAMSLIGPAVLFAGCVAFGVVALWLPRVMTVPFLYLSLLGGFAAAGWWSGWRFGRWGYFWGGIAGLTVSTLVVATLIPKVSPRLRFFIFSALCIAIAALAGHFGAARARRDMKAQTAYAQAVPPADP